MTDLVIGYGNTLRGDDGAGPWVVETIAAAGWPGVRCVTAHQLTPEMSEDVAVAGRVVFVDASVAEETVAVRPVVGCRTGQGGHCCTPSLLLFLAELLHGRCPEAWLVSVPARRLELGEGLAPQTQTAAEEALRVVARILGARRRPPC